MKKKKFTKKEQKYLLSLPAVARVYSKQIIYSQEFKTECMQRYHAGEGPSKIFASVGLPSSLIGYKRIERAIYRWKKAEQKNLLTDEMTSTDNEEVKKI